MTHKRKHIPFSSTTNLYHKNTLYVQLHKCSNHYLLFQKAPLKMFLCDYFIMSNNLCTIYCNCFVHFVLMWPFSISIWICNSVRIHGNKWYDMMIRVLYIMPCQSRCILQRKLAHGHYFDQTWTSNVRPNTTYVNPATKGKIHHPNSTDSHLYLHTVSFKIQHPSDTGFGF